MLPRRVGQVAGNGVDIGWSVVGITVDSTDFCVAAARKGAPPMAGGSMSGTMASWTRFV